MSSLTYTVLTDPASLEASENNRTPSKGTVYLVITNNTKRVVNWSEIKVTVPVGTVVDTLTPNTSGINPTGQYTNAMTNVQTRVTFGPKGTNSFHATARGRSEAFYVGDCMILTLADVTLTVGAGPVVLLVAETVVTGGSSNQPSYAAVAVVKTTPQPIPAPRSFRSDKEMLDTGDSLTLRWDGSDDFNYVISYPNGSSGPIAKPPTGTSYSWSPTAAPTRATTYTLKATSRTTPAQEHFLTTTVQVRHPVLETLTATTGIKTPRLQGTATNWGLTITGTGAEICDDSGVQGTLTAAGVATGYMKGLKNGDGDITFTSGGVKVWRTRGVEQMGTLYADGVQATYVEGPNKGEGVITFPLGGVKVWRTGGSKELGILYARNVNGVASGRSTPGSGGWKAAGPDAFSIEVDTSAAGFTSTPKYLATLEINGGGTYDPDIISGVQNPSATHFTVFLRWHTGVPTTWTVADAERCGWYINWIGCETL
ncbi:hypothetical protein [Nonomuraea typhae]|uniref:hypothetical protein n=1 Tax=Nonomuraea typhae TaxID=2603600 RepID=UPI0012FC1627|nr:hypothetical protein [Nonomuraea typhae]